MRPELIFTYKKLNFSMKTHVWLPNESDDELESEESKGFCVIYIYPGAHKLSLSISHFFWAPQTLPYHHYLIYFYFPFSPFHFPFLHFLSYNQMDSYKYDLFRLRK